jgi:hypothetical protein
MGATTIHRPLRLLALVLMLCALGLVAGAERSSATVLCKTATNPCTGGTYGKGTVIEASLKSGTKSVLHPPFGEIECSKSPIKGEVTNAGGEGANVSGTVTSWSFSECNATVTVLKKGTFRIESTSGGNGTLVLEGFEITTSFIGTHCIWSGPSSIPLSGGSMAAAGTTSTMTRTGGSSGTFCDGGKPQQQWTVDYTVTAPEPLYVSES